MGASPMRPPLCGLARPAAKAADAWARRPCYGLLRARARRFLLGSGKGSLVSSSIRLQLAQAQHLTHVAGVPLVQHAGAAEVTLGLACAGRAQVRVLLVPVLELAGL